MSNPFLRYLSIMLSACAAFALWGCQKEAEPTSKPGQPKMVRLAFVVNNSCDFWMIARAGFRKAEKECNVEVDFQIPGQGTVAQQKQIIEAMIGKEVKGMAISPLAPDSQVAMLNEAAAHMPVVTQDSDSPKSKRVAYVGTDNIEAGRQAGRLIKEVLPKGGKIAVFVGKMDAANARERYQGIQDVLKDANVTVVERGPITDENSRSKAQENVAAVVGKYPDLGCLVGLWSYNGPAILKIVRESKVKVPIVCFDEELATLQGVREGLIHATVVQQPFEFGYQSIKLLAQLARGEKPKIPESKLMYVPTMIIRKDNVDAFEKQMKEVLSQGKRD